MRRRKAPGLIMMLRHDTDDTLSKSPIVRTKVTCSCSHVQVVCIPQCLMYNEAEAQIAMDESLTHLSSLILKNFQMAIECTSCGKDITLDRDRFKMLRQANNAYAN